MFERNAFNLLVLIEVTCIFSPFFSSFLFTPTLVASSATKEFNLLDNKQYSYKTLKTRGCGLPNEEKGMLGNNPREHARLEV